jgi:hypothetical protein
MIISAHIIKAVDRFGGLFHYYYDMNVYDF